MEDVTTPGAMPDTAGRGLNPRKALVRDELMDIAARMFDERGIERTSMGAIAAEMGLGRSALYHYFGSKEEILAALIEAEALAPSLHLKELEERFENAADRLNAAIIEGIERRLSSGARFVRLARLEAQIPDDLLGQYNASRRAIYDFYVTCIEDGIATGLFRPVDSHVAAFGVIGMANWTSRWYKANGRLSARELAIVLADFALAGLRKGDSDDARSAEARSRLRDLVPELEAIGDLLR